MGRIRLSSHRLEVEVGRWAKPNKIPYEDRKCKVCNVLEDEFHFLLECPLYTDVRKVYIRRYYWRHPNMNKFIELISSEHGKTINNYHRILSNKWIFPVEAAYCKQILCPF